MGIDTHCLPPGPISWHEVLKLVAIRGIVVVWDIVEFVLEVGVGNKLPEDLHGVAVPNKVSSHHPRGFGTFYYLVIWILDVKGFPWDIAIGDRVNKIVQILVITERSMVRVNSKTVLP
jgi:hypothetical protein